MRFWLVLNVVLATVQFLVVAAWLELTSAGMSINAESNGVYSYIQDAKLFKAVIATSKNQSYEVTYWPGVFAAVVLIGMIISSARLWSKASVK